MTRTVKAANLKGINQQSIRTSAWCMAYLPKRSIKSSACGMRRRSQVHWPRAPPPTGIFVRLILGNQIWPLLTIWLQRRPYCVRSESEKYAVKLSRGYKSWNIQIGCLTLLMTSKFRRWYTVVIGVYWIKSVSLRALQRFKSKLPCIFSLKILQL